MLRFVVRRLAAAVVTVWLATILVFFLLTLVPGDPVGAMLMEVGGAPPTQAEVDAPRSRWGFDRPAAARYLIWLSGVLRGDLGESLMTGLPALQMVVNALPATMELAFSAMFIATIIAFPLGILSSTRRNTAVDFASRIASLIGVCMPGFWLALLLMLVFAVDLRWLPVFGRGELRHLILPAITLGAGMAALSARLIRSSMLEVLQEDFIRTARAKGLSERVVIWTHALKSAMVPVITILGLQLGVVLGGSAIVEKVFAWPGIGLLMVNAIFARDFIVVQAVTLVFAAIMTTVNTLVDICYTYLDPRIRC